MGQLEPDQCGRSRRSRRRVAGDVSGCRPKLRAIPLISGGFRWVRGQQRSSVLLFLEPPDRFPVPLADKHRLVPIGEWIPPLPAG